MSNLRGYFGLTTNRGRKAGIFDSGSLQSAQSESDALMVLQVTYVYAESGSQGNWQPQ